MLIQLGIADLLKLKVGTTTWFLMPSTVCTICKNISAVKKKIQVE